jgi:hypothetical protein
MNGALGAHAVGHRLVLLSPRKLERRKIAMYNKALSYARREEYEIAQRHFEGLLTLHPTLCKAWVSYAQV